MKTIALAPLSEREAACFSLESLRSPRLFRVTRVVEKSNVHVLLEYDEGDLKDPSADPLIIGTITKEIDKDEKIYQARVTWGGKVWRTLDEDTSELFSMLSGIKPEAMKDFAEKVRNGHFGSLCPSSHRRTDTENKKLQE